MRRFGAATAIIGTLVATGPAQAACGPWSWRDGYHPIAWQHAHERPRPYFAPPGCFVVRRVAMPDGVSWQSIYICR